MDISHIDHHSVQKAHWAVVQTSIDSLHNVIECAHCAKVGQLCSNGGAWIASRGQELFLILFGGDFVWRSFCNQLNNYLASKASSSSPSKMFRRGGWCSLRAIKQAEPWVFVVWDGSPIMTESHLNLSLRGPLSSGKISLKLSIQHWQWSWPWHCWEVAHTLAWCMFRFLNRSLLQNSSPLVSC